MFIRIRMWLKTLKNLMFSTGAPKSYKAANKVIPYKASSTKALSELLAAAQASNNSDKSYLGIDKRRKEPYFVDFRASINSKSIFVIDLSDSRKNGLVLSWMLDFYALNYNICLISLKGNELLSFIKAINGTTISMRPDSTKFVNTFKLKASEAEDYEAYYHSRIELSKRILLTISNLGENQYREGEALIEDFLKCLYSLRGITGNNPKTWKRSEGLTPDIIYDEFLNYMTTSRRKFYHDVAEIITRGFNIYLNPKSKKAYMFKEELVSEEIYGAKALAFDFGLSDSSEVLDPVIYKLRVMFMDIVSNEYTKYKKSKQEWVLKILEETPMAEDHFARIYREEMMQRSPRYQVTVLLGKSIQPLTRNDEDKKIFETISLLCIGKINEGDREYFADKLEPEEYRATLEKIKNDSSHENTFLLVNGMEKTKASTLLQAIIQPEFRNK